jgi:tetratricopeptide (TPR) repeat protein
MAVFVVLSLVTGHFIVAYAAVATPSAARSLNEWTEQISSIRTRWLPLLAHPILFLVLGIAAVTPKLMGQRERHSFESAVNVLDEEKLRGPFFNVPETGGLLGWVVGPDQIPFSDLRPSSLILFQHASRDDRSPVDSAQEEVRLAILSWDFLPLHRDKSPSEESDFWLVYLDDAALIYASPKSNSRAVESMAFRHFDPMSDPRDYTREIVPSVSRELFAYFQRYPKSSHALVKLGPLLLREGRNEEALEVFEAARLLKPQDPFIWKNLSELYLHKGMYGLAEQASRRGLAIARDDDFVFYLANALYGQGQFEEAVEWFEEVLRLEPDNQSALRAIVDIHQRLERTERSSEHRQRLEQLESSRLKSLLEEAETRKSQLDFGGAALAYQEARDILPADEGILWNLTVALLTDNRNEEATHVLREIVRQRPEHALAHLTLGSLCTSKVQCEPEEARRHLETFLVLSPNDINADLARSELARLPPKKR